jgi:hypothetical protein
VNFNNSLGADFLAFSPFDSASFCALISSADGLGAGFITTVRQLLGQALAHCKQTMHFGFIGSFGLGTSSTGP